MLTVTIVKSSPILRNAIPNLATNHTYTIHPPIASDTAELSTKEILWQQLGTAGDVSFLHWKAVATFHHLTSVRAHTQ